MKVKRIRLFVIVAATLVAAFLGYREYSHGRVASSGHPLVFYDETGVPSEQAPALSRREIKRVLDLVATRTDDPVWLIWVRPSQRYDVYIVPDEVTPRTRVGRAYSIRKSEQPMVINANRKYMQVCQPQCRFAGKLTMPLVADLPFDPPVIVDPNAGGEIPMAAKEIIDIVDFVRQQKSLSPSLNLLHIAQHLPVLHISKEGQAIHVRLGFMHDVLWGHGITIAIECIPGGYRVVNWDQWIS